LNSGDGKPGVPLDHCCDKENGQLQAWSRNGKLWEFLVDVRIREWQPYAAGAL